VQLSDVAGNVLPVGFVDPMASITLDPPIYPGARMGDGGPATGEVTHTSFSVEWAGSYCGPAPGRLLLYDSSWVGNAGTPIIASLSNSSPPCGSASGGAGTITVDPVGGYPLPSPAWAGLQASMHSVDASTTPPSFVVRLANPTDQTVPLRPCFSYAVGIVEHGADGSSDGEASDGNPDCTKLPATLPPGGSVDLPVTPAALYPEGTPPILHATVTWLMPDGPHASVQLP
jgi:hypothetical protein